jgi:hypothetical protein
MILSRRILLEKCYVLTFGTSGLRSVDDRRWCARCRLHVCLAVCRIALPLGTMGRWVYCIVEDKAVSHRIQSSSRKVSGAKPTSRRRSASKRTAGPKTRRISHLRKPADMSLNQWQVALRRQYAKEQKFHVENIGREPVFSEFLVANPETEGRYRVAIRGPGLGDNYCSCPDFAVNTLGTCKHVEFVLARLARRREAKRAFAQGFRPPYSEVYLRYGSQRRAAFRAGAECPPSLSELASDYFDESGLLKPQAVPQFETFLHQAGRIAHELRCYDDALDFIAEVRDRQNLPKRIAKVFPKGIKGPAFTGLLKVSLYPYQRAGLSWPTTWGWARPSRQSRRSRYSHERPASNEC